MHVPDGFLDAPTSVGTAVVAVGGVALALRGARRELDDRTAPLAGLVALFIFSTQLLNFPIAAGTSGHLLGGALAAVLVGPCTATLSITVVLLVQATLMADGGITALGTNITLMGLVGVWTGWLVFVALRRVLPQRPLWVVPSAALAALVSVPTAAFAFALLFDVGGTVDVPFATVATTMVGIHILIGVGEAVITALAVLSIVVVRPDLVHGARPILQARTLEIREGVAA